jgi:putative transposase
VNRLPERKTLRLSQYDYSGSGAYFVTVCTQEKRCTLGRVVGGGVLDAPHVQLSEYGDLAQQTLLEMSAAYSNIAIEKYAIMPNHVHFIIAIRNCSGPSRTPAPTNARLPAFISTWKRFTNKRAGTPLWQRSYYDHVIRGEADYLRIWQYIDQNPARWAEDEYYQESPQRRMTYV